MKQVVGSLTLYLCLFLGTNKLRFGLAAGVPFYEDYNGIQMDEDFSLHFGLKYEHL